MFKEIISKALTYDLSYMSDLLLDRSTILESSFHDNSFMFEDKLFVKILDKIWSNNYL